MGDKLNLTIPKYIPYVFFCVLSAYLFYNSAALGFLYPVSWSVFIAAGCLCQRAELLQMEIIFVLLSAVVLNEAAAAAGLILSLIFLLTGAFLKKTASYKYAFAVCVILMAIFMITGLFLLDYGGLFDIKKVLKTGFDSLKLAAEEYNKAGRPTLNLDYDKLYNISLKFFPSFIINFGVVFALANLGIAVRYLALKGIHLNDYFRDFHVSTFFAVPILALSALFFLGKDQTGGYMSVVTGNVIAVGLFVIALQGMSVVFFISRNVKGFLKGILNFLTVLIFLMEPFIYISLGFADIALNVRKQRRSLK